MFLRVGNAARRHLATHVFRWNFLFGSCYVLGERQLQPTSRGLLATAVAPFWFLTMASSVLPVGWTTARWRERVRRRRCLRDGRCIACGYDLRATPDRTGATLARCPECGKTAA